MSRWFRGIWLGRSDRSHHHLIGDEFGNVVAANAIKGLPEERRWDVDLLAKLRGVPWALKGEVETEVVEAPPPQALSCTPSGYMARWGMMIVLWPPQRGTLVAPAPP